MRYLGHGLSLCSGLRHSHFVFSIVFLKSNVKHFHSFGLVVFSNNDVCVCALRILLSYQICLLQCNVYF